MYPLTLFWLLLEDRLSSPPSYFSLSEVDLYFILNQNELYKSFSFQVNLNWKVYVVFIIISDFSDTPIFFFNFKPSHSNIIKTSLVVPEKLQQFCMQVI